MKRKVISIVLAAGLAMSMLAGCGNETGAGENEGQSTTASEEADNSEEAAAGEKTKLTVYCNAVVKNDTPDIITAFNEEYPNIEVEYVELPADATKKNQTLSTILQAQDDSMDVFLIDTTWPESYTASGWLEPLGDVLSDEEKEGYMQGPIDACTIDGQLMALPAFMDAGVLLYRKDLLDKYGYEAPQTWDELCAQAKDIVSKEENMAGFVTAWKQYENLTCSVVEFVKSYGGDIVDNEGNVKIGSKESGAGIQKMYDMIYKDQITDQGITGYTNPDAAAIFNSGNAVFFRAWPSNYVESNNEEVSSVVGKTAVTSLPKGDDASYSCLGGWSVGVSSFSKNKDAAKTFAKFFSGEKANKIRALAGGNLPVVKSVYEDEDVKAAMPQFEYLLPCAQNAVARPKSAYYEEVSASVQQGISNVLAGTATVEESQATMQKEIEEIMNR